jgi:hypothetical protein
VSTIASESKAEVSFSRTPFLRQNRDKRADLTEN